METICKPCNICIEPNCKTRASYNLKNEPKPMYCASHKKELMVDIINKKCIEPNCKTLANYNFENEKKFIYCKLHAKENMLDIKNKKCIEPNCKTRAIYNFKDKKQGVYCLTHKLDMMQNVKDKKCLDCDTVPIYNFKDKNTGIYCNLHKKNLMVDIRHKTCIEENCEIRAGYNIEGKKQGVYCFDHKKDKMIDVSHKRCLTNMCQLRGTKKYEGYCLFCFINTFPDKPVTRNYKTKEKAVSDYIKEQFPDVTWVLDKKIADGCSKRRPDLLLDLGYEVIIIEIDENQHSSYEDICENKRIMIISQDLNFRPIIFIRFNPDDYIINDKKITSCWGPDGNGRMSVKKTKKKEWIIRLEKLKETVTYWITNISEKPIEIDNLFFDEII